MTTEEKAKAYDDALERAKKYSIDDAYSSQSAVIKSIFPELSESEDERIRRELIEYLRGDLDDITTDDTDRWITWIEKQKEPHFTKRNALFDKCVENCDPEIMKRVSDEVDAMLEKEQKRDGGDDYNKGYIKGRAASWKPSEEQMGALLNAEGLVRANNYPENAKILAALYEQLKKLM